MNSVSRSDREAHDEDAHLRELLNRATAALDELTAEKRALEQSRALLAAEEERYRTLNRELEGREAKLAGEVEAANARVEVEREQLGVLVAQFPAAVVVIDRAGAVVRTNEQAEHLLRKAGADPRQLSSYDRLVLRRPGGEILLSHEGPLQRAFREGEETLAERFVIGLADGTLRTLEMSAVPLRDGEGQMAGALLAATDVSDRDRRERAEREFVANASHQLRNPLAAIRGAIEVLQSGAKDDPPARERFLLHIERESDRLTRIATSLLALARAQAGIETPKREIVDVPVMLEELAEQLAAPPGGSITVRAEPGLATLANHDLLYEALASLTDNAVRHSGASVVCLEARAEGDLVVVEVSDDGRGIPAEVRERIFERFNRNGEGGSGLGLAIAAAVVEAIEGTLEIDSEPGRGTRVRLRLPGALRLSP